MAFAANDLVINRSVVTASYLVPALESPLLGAVEDVTAGPTDVDWSDGSRVTYTADGQLLKIIGADASTNALIGSRVRLTPISNAGQRAEGIVMWGIGLADSAAVDQGDFVLVKFDNGTFVLVPVADVAVVS
jgi:hypothetical protein